MWKPGPVRRDLWQLRKVLLGLIRRGLLARLIKLCKMHVYGIHLHMFLRATSGYVKLLLETEDGNVTTFQRSISQAAGKGNYVSVYAINEATVTWASYEEKLKSFGILIKARNFLVFQVSRQAVVSPHLQARNGLSFSAMSVAKSIHRSQSHHAASTTPSHSID